MIDSFGKLWKRNDELRWTSPDVTKVLSKGAPTLKNRDKRTQKIKYYNLGLKNTVKQLLVAAAWAAAASSPMCILSLERTDDGITVWGRVARRMPKRSWFFSFLRIIKIYLYENKISGAQNEMYRGEFISKFYQINRTESPATRRLALTKTLQPVVSKWRLGWPESRSRKSVKHAKLNGNKS